MNRPFNEDEFLLLSRRGSVGTSIRSRPHQARAAPFEASPERVARSARRRRRWRVRPRRRVLQLLAQQRTGRWHADLTYGEGRTVLVASVAQRKSSGLQSRVERFDSSRRLSTDIPGAAQRARSLPVARAGVGPTSTDASSLGWISQRAHDPGEEYHHDQNGQHADRRESVMTDVNRGQDGQHTGEEQRDREDCGTQPETLSRRDEPVALACGGSPADGS